MRRYKYFFFINISGIIHHVYSYTCHCSANLYVIQSTCCQRLQEYLGRNIIKKDNKNRMPFLGQLLHMGQTVELSNVIETCGLYPSLSDMACEYTTEDFRKTFNHVMKSRKEGSDSAVFEASMNHLSKCNTFMESIKKTIIRSSKLFLQSNPSSGLVYFLLEYYLHLGKTLEAISTTNDFFEKGNITGGVANKNYPLRTLHFTATGQDKDEEMTNLKDVIFHDQKVGNQQFLLSLRTVGLCVLKSVRETDTPMTSVLATIKSAKNAEKLFKHDLTDIAKKEDSSKEKENKKEDKKGENQQGSKLRQRGDKDDKKKEGKEDEKAKDPGEKSSSGRKKSAKKSQPKKKNDLSKPSKEKLVAVFDAIENAERDGTTELPEVRKLLEQHLQPIKSSVCALASELLKKKVAVKEDLIDSVSPKGKSSKTASKAEEKKSASATKTNKQKAAAQEEGEKSTVSKSEIINLFSAKIMQSALSTECSILSELPDTDSVTKVVATEFGYHSETDIKTNSMESNVVIMKSDFKKKMHQKFHDPTNQKKRFTPKVRNLLASIESETKSRGWTTSLTVNPNETESDYIVFLPQSVHEAHMKSEPVQMALQDNFHKGSQNKQGSDAESLFGDSTGDEEDEGKPKSKKKDSTKNPEAKRTRVSKKDAQSKENLKKAAEPKEPTDESSSENVHESAPSTSPSPGKKAKKNSSTGKSSSPAGKPKNDAVAKGAAAKEKDGKSAGKKRALDNGEAGSPKRGKTGTPSPSRSSKRIQAQKDKDGK